MVAVKTPIQRDEDILKIACETPLPRGGTDDELDEFPDDWQKRIFFKLGGFGARKGNDGIKVKTSTPTPGHLASAEQGAYPTPNASAEDLAKRMPVTPLTDGQVFFNGAKDPITPLSSDITTFEIFLEDPRPERKRNKRRSRPTSISIHVDNDTAVIPPMIKRRRTDVRQVLSTKYSVNATPTPLPRNSCEPFRFNAADPLWEDIENYEVPATAE